jgi:uncharacterized metal-binding protein YceD (DUF177 family)
VDWKTKYDIAFKGLAEGLHEFNFYVDGKFFEHFDRNLVDEGKVRISAILEKRGTFMKLHLNIEGEIEFVCDMCLENYMQKIKNNIEIFVKFGEKEFDEDENVIWLLPEEHQLNLAQIIYEYTALSIPLRHIHPKNKNGERGCKKEMIDKLKHYIHKEKDGNTFVDPRCNILKNLNNN